MKLDAAQVHAAYYCCAWTIRAREYHRHPVPDSLRNLFDCLDKEIRLSRTRQEISCAGTESESAWIGSPEAAAILGWSIRQVQRRAPDLDGRKVAGRWVFHEETVKVYAEETRTDG